ncbi:MAG: hypothetical protein LBE91_09920 [Tannerella sp.]|jgi:hypothetical protein|nr:hypothetical protein [Tannerella sp.]
MKTVNTIIAVVCTVFLIISVFPGFGWLAYIYGGFASLMLILSFFGGEKGCAALFFFLFAIVRLLGGGLIGF